MVVEESGCGCGVCVGVCDSVALLWVLVVFPFPFPIHVSHSRFPPSVLLLLVVLSSLLTSGMVELTDMCGAVGSQ